MYKVKQWTLIKSHGWTVFDVLSDTTKKLKPNSKVAITLAPQKKYCSECELFEFTSNIMEMCDIALYTCSVCNLSKYIVVIIKNEDCKGKKTVDVGVSVCPFDMSHNMM